MNPGNYIETGQMLLTHSVSIMGAGKNLVTLKLTYDSDYPCIKLESSDPCRSVYGNQSISGIRFDGDRTGLIAIGVSFRCNVHIYDCEFINFNQGAAYFSGQLSDSFTLDNPYVVSQESVHSLMPDNNGWCTGNKFYNNLVLNCSASYPGGSYGSVYWGTQDGFEIYNNNIDCKERHGVGLKYWDLGYNKNSKIHHNDIETDTYPFDCTIESWFSLGGDEIYNNRIKGDIDINNAVDYYSVGYSIRIYNNNIGRNTTPMTLERGILLEGTCEYLQIYKNNIHHVAKAIYFLRNNTGGIDRLYNININTNLMSNLGQSGTDLQTWGIECSDIMSNEGTLENVKIQNNIIHSLGTTIPNTNLRSAYGIVIPKVNRMNHFYIDNNIILNFYRGAILGEDSRQLADVIFIRNNIMFGNGNNNDPVFNINFVNSLSNYTYARTIKSNPLFASMGTDYHLLAGSPAIYQGVYVGLLNDYDGRAWRNPPSIGIYEYTTVASPTPTPSRSLSRTPTISLSISTYPRPPEETVVPNAYYVATNGNDSNPGTFSQPWATWQHALDVATAGDTVYIMGGVYYPANRLISGAYNGAVRLNRSGTASNYIKIWAYPGQTPILDGRDVVGNARHYGLNFEDCSYYHLKGLTIRNFTEYGKVRNCPIAVGVRLFRSSHFIIERMVVHDCGDGFSSSGLSDYNHYIDCDAYNCYDYTDAGGYANGFTLTSYQAGAPCHLTLTRCRAWGNSDDGFDFFASDGSYRGGYITLDTCWAFKNGWGPGGNGNGSGIKLGKVFGRESGIQRTVINCLCFENRLIGFDESMDDGAFVDVNMYNNTSYGNGSQGFLFNFTYRSGTVTFRNNVSYNNARPDAFRSSGIVHDHNSWDIPLSLSNSDFKSLSSVGMDAPRVNGALPVLDFLKPSSSSKLLRAGVNVGLTYDGAGNRWNTPPAIGAYEFVTVAPEPPSRTPTPSRTPSSSRREQSPENAYYVSADGDDISGNGTINSPWRTLSKINSMNIPAGSTVYFRRGDTFRGHLYIKNSGNAGPTTGIYCIGDSLTSGGFPSQLQTELTSIYRVYDKGVNDNTTSQMVSRFSADVINNSDHHYVIIFGGISDISAGTSVSTIQNNLQTMYNNARNSGAKVIAVTLTPFGSASWWTLARQTNLENVNNWIKNNAINVDYVVDGYTIMKNPTSPYSMRAEDTTDGLRFTDSGRQRLTNGILAAVDFWPFNPKPITFDAYGTGNKPRIWGSKDYSSTSQWTVYSGNIWRTTTQVTTYSDVANLIFNNEASCGIKRTTLSGCVGQGQWYISPIDRFVYLYSTSNPGSYYSHIEIGGAYICADGYSTEEVIRVSNSDFIILRNLDVRYSGNNGIIFINGCSHGIVEYCDISWIGGMWVPSDPSYRMGNGVQMWQRVNDLKIRYNNIHDCYDAGISPQGGVNFTQSNVKMSYNRIWNCYYEYETWAEDSSVTMKNVNFYNNTCVNATSWSVNQRPDSSNARHVMIWVDRGNIINCEIKNNIFKTCSNPAIRYGNPSHMTPKFTFDNNLYNVAILAYTDDGTYTTFAQWRAKYPTQDINSISADPLFVSGNDFHLQSGSPAINAGAYLGFSNDIEGRSIFGAPDIGAYETLAPGVSPPSTPSNSRTPSASQPAPSKSRTPIMSLSRTPSISLSRTPTQSPPTIVGGSIIANHTISRYIVLNTLSDVSISNAKSKLLIAYEHTSHGEQIIQGMTGLMNSVMGGSPKFDFINSDIHSANRLSIHDHGIYGGGGADLGGGGDYTAFYNQTRAYLNSHPNCNVVMWSWCGQLSYLSSSVVMSNYLSLMASLENEYASRPVKFVYMTGHLDGTGSSGNLHQRNEQIRAHCATNNRILFDFADIERYDPNGVDYLNLGADDGCNYDGGNWAINWQNSHTVNVDWYNCASSHSQPLNANMKAYAAWWMFTKIAERL